MNNMQPGIFAVWPIILYGAIVLVLVGAMLALSHFWAPGTGAGRQPAGRVRDTADRLGAMAYGSHYYLVGLFFISYSILRPRLFLRGQW